MASMSVFTPCGHRQETRMPSSPCTIASHSKSESAAAFVTPYGAAKKWLSSPAAETVPTR
jgi:hypothetical protein